MAMVAALVGVLFLLIVRDRLPPGSAPAATPIERVGALRDCVSSWRRRGCCRCWRCLRSPTLRLPPCWCCGRAPICTIYYDLGPIQRWLRAGGRWPCARRSAVSSSGRSIASLQHPQGVVVGTASLSLSITLSGVALR
jgi:hypothetical protein